MKSNKSIKAGALSTVIVVSVLMMLMVISIISLWDIGAQLFYKTQYLRSQKACIESAYLVYCTHPELFTQKKNEFLVFDDSPSSKVMIELEQWGLYELVSVKSSLTRFSKTGLIGLRLPSVYGAGFYHPENLLSITLAGNTNILTSSYLPHNGFVYGQMNSNFFYGERVEKSMIKHSDTSFPLPTKYSLEVIDSLFSMVCNRNMISDSASVEFYGESNLALCADGVIKDCVLSGKVVVIGDKLRVDSTARLEDVIVICSNLIVGKGFEGSMQVFARDSVIVESNANLLYPSGIYAENKAILSDSTQINGYVIVNPSSPADKPKANYISARKSLVRGFVYVNGVAQLQGIVSGSTYVKDLVYYSQGGYYSGMIYDFTLLENPYIAYPIWLDKGKRRVAKWLK